LTLAWLFISETLWLPVLECLTTSSDLPSLPHFMGYSHILDSLIISLPYEGNVKKSPAFLMFYLQHSSVGSAYVHIYSGVGSLTICSCYANISVFIDCKNNEFLKKWIMIMLRIEHSRSKFSGWLRYCTYTHVNWYMCGTAEQEFSEYSLSFLVLLNEVLTAIP
jgi:hypothetical protein